MLDGSKQALLGSIIFIIINTSLIYWFYTDPVKDVFNLVAMIFSLMGYVLTPLIYKSIQYYYSNLNKK